jgi:uncharacterized protein (TIGR02646 family)
MRYIPLLEQDPGNGGDAEQNEKIKKWLRDAEDLRKQMEAAPDDEARKKIIDDHSEFWGLMKDWLLSLSHGKCWFTEARDCINYYHVEHFRPKKSAKDIDGKEHAGYWWLAFDWKNFRICGNVLNPKKGTYFPLRKDCKRVELNGDIRLEEPLLLDPADPEDPSLLSFDVYGKAIIAPGVDDEWEKERIQYSIDRYNLNGYALLVDQRKLVWSECWRLIQQYRSELMTYRQNRSPIARQQVKSTTLDIRLMLREDKEFSAVARACIMSSGEDVRGLLQSM